MSVAYLRFFLLILFGLGVDQNVMERHVLAADSHEATRSSKKGTSDATLQKWCALQAQTEWVKQTYLEFFEKMALLKALQEQHPYEYFLKYKLNFDAMWNNSARRKYGREFKKEFEELGRQIEAVDLQEMQEPVGAEASEGDAESLAKQSSLLRIQNFASTLVHFEHKLAHLAALFEMSSQGRTDYPAAILKGSVDAPGTPDTCLHDSGNIGSMAPNFQSVESPYLKAFEVSSQAQRREQFEVEGFDTDFLEPAQCREWVEKKRQQYSKTAESDSQRSTEGHNETAQGLKKETEAPSPSPTQSLPTQPGFHQRLRNVQLVALPQSTPNQSAVQPKEQKEFDNGEFHARAKEARTKEIDIKSVSDSGKNAGKSESSKKIEFGRTVDSKVTSEQTPMNRGRSGKKPAGPKAISSQSSLEEPTDKVLEGEKDEDFTDQPLTAEEKKQLQYQHDEIEQKLSAPKSEDMTAKTRSANELQDLAYFSLQQFKKTTNLKIDWSNFFFDAEGLALGAGLTQAQFTSIKKNWWEKTAGYQQIVKENASSPLSARVALFETLYKDYLQNYSNSDALFLDLLRYPQLGANSRAQTKLILSAVQKAELQLALSQELVIESAIGSPKRSDQSFRNRVLIFDSKTQQVMDPVTGKAVEELTHPLYHPALLLKEYLDQNKAVAPVTLRDLVRFDPSKTVKIPKELPKEPGTADFQKPVQTAVKNDKATPIKKPLATAPMSDEERRFQDEQFQGIALEAKRLAADEAKFLEDSKRDADIQRAREDRNKEESNIFGLFGAMTGGMGALFSHPKIVGSLISHLDINDLSTVLKSVDAKVLNQALNLNGADLEKVLDDPRLLEEAIQKLKSTPDGTQRLGEVLAKADPTRLTQAMQQSTELVRRIQESPELKGTLGELAAGGTPDPSTLAKAERALSREVLPEDEAIMEKIEVPSAIQQAVGKPRVECKYNDFETLCERPTGEGAGESLYFNNTVIVDPTAINDAYPIARELTNKTRPFALFHHSTWGVQLAFSNADLLIRFLNIAQRQVADNRTLSDADRQINHDVVTKENYEFLTDLHLKYLHTLEATPHYKRLQNILEKPVSIKEFSMFEVKDAISTGAEIIRESRLAQERRHEFEKKSAMYARVYLGRPVMRVPDLDPELSAQRDLISKYQSFKERLEKNLDATYKLFESMDPKDRIKLAYLYAGSHVAGLSAAEPHVLWDVLNEHLARSEKFDFKLTPKRGQPVEAERGQLKEVFSRTPRKLQSTPQDDDSKLGPHSSGKSPFSRATKARQTKPSPAQDQIDELKERRGVERATVPSPSKSIDQHDLLSFLEICLDPPIINDNGAPPCLLRHWGPQLAEELQIQMRRLEKKGSKDSIERLVNIEKKLQRIIGIKANGFSEEDEKILRETIDLRWIREQNKKFERF